MNHSSNPSGECRLAGQTAGATRRLMHPKDDILQLCSDLEVQVERGTLATTAAAFDGATAAAQEDMAQDAEALLADFELLVSASALRVEPQRRMALLDAARRAVPRTALMLSGGGLLGNYHFGVLRSLLRHALLPNIISGSSAGAFAAAIAASWNDQDLADALTASALSAQSRDRAASLRQSMSSSKSRPDGARLKRRIAETIPNMTFAETLAVSGRSLNIVVTAECDATAFVLNPLTTPDVLVRGAVLASCAVPGHFASVALEQRTQAGELRPFRASRRWVDGSLSADLPADALSELYGSHLTIASMVNPIVLPWLRDPHAENGLMDEAIRLFARATKAYVKVAGNLSLMVAGSAPRLGFLIRCWSNVASQSYAGDINLLPKRRLHDPFSLIDEADENSLRTFIAEGERITDRRLSMLRACTLLDRRLDRLAPAMTVSA